MASTCFGHLHVHLQECLYVVSLPHVVLCPVKKRDMALADLCINICCA